MRISTHSVKFVEYACLHHAYVFRLGTIICVLARIWSMLGHMRVSTCTLVLVSDWSFHRMSASTHSVTGGANAG